MGKRHREQPRYKDNPNTLRLRWAHSLAPPSPCSCGEGQASGRCLRRAGGLQASHLVHDPLPIISISFLSSTLFQNKSAFKRKTQLHVSAFTDFQWHYVHSQGKRPPLPAGASDWVPRATSVRWGGLVPTQWLPLPTARPCTSWTLPSRLCCPRILVQHQLIGAVRLWVFSPPLDFSTFCDFLVAHVTNDLQ